MNYEINASERCQEQQLIFGKETISSAKEFDIPDQFYEKGFCLVRNVAFAKQAESILQSVIDTADKKRAPLFAHFAKKTQLAKRDRIPVCEPSVQTSFSALHFDHAQPILANSPQLMQTLIGLYCPTESVNASAKTRVVSIASLFSQKKFGTKEEVSTRLMNYASKFGDGWEKPSKVNTKRIACFGRAIDALTEEEALILQWNQRMDEWFAAENDTNGEKSLSKERAFYAERGIDLTKCEEEITLRPGDLLIIDNLRAIHGRIGKRERAEIWQFMFGVQNANSHDVNLFRHWLANQAGK